MNIVWNFFKFEGDNRKQKWLMIIYFLVFVFFYSNQDWHSHISASFIPAGLYCLPRSIPSLTHTLPNLHLDFNCPLFFSPTNIMRYNWFPTYSFLLCSTWPHHLSLLSFTFFSNGHTLTVLLMYSLIISSLVTSFSHLSNLSFNHGSSWLATFLHHRALLVIPLLRKSFLSSCSSLVCHTELYLYSSSYFSHILLYIVPHCPTHYFL